MFRRDSNNQIFIVWQIYIGTSNTNWCFNWPRIRTGSKRRTVPNCYSIPSETDQTLSKTMKKRKVNGVDFEFSCQNFIQWNKRYISHKGNLTTKIKKTWKSANGSNIISTLLQWITLERRLPVWVHRTTIQMCPSWLEKR